MNDPKRALPDETFEAIAEDLGFETWHLCIWIAKHFKPIGAEEYAAAEMAYRRLTPRSKVV